MRGLVLHGTEPKLLELVSTYGEAGTAMASSGHPGAPLDLARGNEQKDASESRAKFSHSGRIHLLSVPPQTEGKILSAPGTAAA